MNQERWNRELAKDLLDLAREIVSEEGGVTAASMGETFDMGRVKNYLSVGAQSFAEAVNAQTYEAVTKAVETDGIKAASNVYSEASGERAKRLAESRATQLASWSVMEAARQVED